MTSPQPFSLRIFVADGDPDGLRLVERSNWIGKALVFPRKLYPEFRTRQEFQNGAIWPSHSVPSRPSASRCCRSS